MLLFTLGFVTCFALSLTLVYLVPGKALKFAAKFGTKLGEKIGPENVERLRKIAELL